MATDAWHLYAFCHPDCPILKPETVTRRPPIYTLLLSSLWYSVIGTKYWTEKKAARNISSTFAATRTIGSPLST